MQTSTLIQHKLLRVLRSPVKPSPLKALIHGDASRPLQLLPAQVSHLMSTIWRPCQSIGEARQAVILCLYTILPPTAFYTVWNQCVSSSREVATGLLPPPKENLVTLLHPSLRNSAVIPVSKLQCNQSFSFSSAGSQSSTVQTLRPAKLRWLPLTH